MSFESFFVFLRMRPNTAYSFALDFESGFLSSLVVLALASASFAAPLVDNAYTLDLSSPVHDNVKMGMSR